MSSDLILARLQALHPKMIDLSLHRLNVLLADLGHPERKTAPVVHIAGTNGKGSTLAMLDQMLRASRRRVQRYISPHLVHFNERILFDGQPIDESAFSDVLDHAERANAGRPITFFEITTAAAFLAFAERAADVLLLETGLGGRLDATNVIDQPLLTLISPVSLDHQGFLGDRVEQIAAEKAGILKPGVPCVLGPQRQAALDVIRSRAKEIGAPLLIHGQHWSVSAKEGRLEVMSGDRCLDLPLPALAGRHQIENAGLAAVAALQLGALSPDLEAMAAGLRQVTWPARLQLLRTGPLAVSLPQGFELWLDGGHNPAAGEVLAAHFNDGDPRPLHLIIGMLRTKDQDAFMAPLAPLLASIHAVPVPDEPASREPLEAVGMAEKQGIEALVADGVAEALADILAKERGPARVVICGSLYLAGHVLKANG